MRTILHASFYPESSEDLDKAFSLYKKIREVGFDLHFSYAKNLKENKIPISSRGKTKGAPLKRDGWVEKTLKEQFLGVDRNFIHSAHRDNDKIIKRFYKEDRSSKELIPKERWNRTKLAEILQSGQLYFEGKLGGNPNVLVQQNDECFFTISDSLKIKGIVKIYNKGKHERFDTNNKYGFRLIKRNKRSKYNDRYHCLFDYENGLEENKNTSNIKGWLGIDFNAGSFTEHGGNFCLSIIDMNGNFVKHKIIDFGKKYGAGIYDTKGDAKENILTLAIRKAVRYAKKNNLGIAIENLADGTGNAPGRFLARNGFVNKSLVRFPKKINQATWIRQAIKFQVPLRIVPSEYTSKIGISKYFDDIKTSFPYASEGHAAAFVIAKRALSMGCDIRDFAYSYSKVKKSGLTAKEFAHNLFKEKRQVCRQIELNELPVISCDLGKGKNKKHFSLSEKETKKIAERIISEDPTEFEKKLYPIYTAIYSGGNKACPVSSRVKKILLDSFNETVIG